MFQSTHPQGVRRLSLRLRDISDDVSIHAPARGATWSDGRAEHHSQVSIHAPARGATCLRFLISMQSNVSIHAPARGATWPESSKHSAYMFQSTHPQGVRPGDSSMTVAGNQFQSTHPQGVRRAIAEQHNCCDKFQSTHPQGVRQSGDFR